LRTGGGRLLLDLKAAQSLKYLRSCLLGCRVADGDETIEGAILFPELDPPCKQSVGVLQAARTPKTRVWFEPFKMVWERRKTSEIGVARLLQREQCVGCPDSVECVYGELGAALSSGR